MAVNGGLSALRLLPALLALTVCGRGTAAQNLSLGFKGGFTRSTVSSTDHADLILSRSGRITGVFLQSQMTGALALQLGVSYAGKGFELTPAPNATAGTDLGATVRLKYREIPVLAVLSPVSAVAGFIAPNIFFGPVLGQVRGCQIDIEIDGEAGFAGCNWPLNLTDMGLQFGGGLTVSIRFASFVLAVAYTKGLRNLDAAPASTDLIKNRNLSGTIGIMVPLFRRRT